MVEVNKSEVDTMKCAYGKLYLLENTLRSYIIRKMELVYGPNWFHLAPRLVLKRGAKKDFDKLNLHELERHYLQSYPEAFKFLPPLFLQSLHTIYPLRNKIAHSHFLSPPEVEKLLTSAELIIKYIEKKMNSC
ncbi:Swt1 family HEPN domain-containing protein [Rossellomorea sp. FS2]|uniref:Swt1 family HEPN domain-containing protein n=1 Tax=Rossellomorea sp. FS2 TaxID=3391447 RepID=UPI003A4D8C61